MLIYLLYDLLRQRRANTPTNIFLHTSCLGMFIASLVEKDLIMKKNSTAPSTPEEHVFPPVVTFPQKSDAEKEADHLRHEEQKLFKTCAKNRDFKPYFDRYPHGQFTKEQAELSLAQTPTMLFSCLCVPIAIIAALVYSPVFWILFFLYLVFF